MIKPSDRRVSCQWENRWRFTRPTKPAGSAGLWRKLITQRNTGVLDCRLCICSTTSTVCKRALLDLVNHWTANSYTAGSFGSIWNLCVVSEKMRTRNGFNWMSYRSSSIQVHNNLPLNSGPPEWGSEEEHLVLRRKESRSFIFFYCKTKHKNLIYYRAEMLADFEKHNLRPFFKWLTSKKKSSYFTFPVYLLSLPHVTEKV